MSWTAVTDLCERLEQRLDDIAHATVTRIRDQLTTFQAVPFDEHIAAVKDRQRTRLVAIAEGRPMTKGDLDTAAELIRVRAKQGLRLETLIGAYHIGDQELWRWMARDAGDARPWLPEIAGLMMETLQSITVAVAAAHAEVAQAQQGQRMTIAQRLVEMVRDGKTNPEAASLAEALGFSPHGEFVVGVCRSAGDMLPPTHRPPIVAAAAQLDGIGVVVAQGTDRAAVLRLLEAQVGNGPAGIGWARSGLAGLCDSLGDAMLAMAAAGPDRRVANIRDNWLSAAVLSRSKQLMPLLEPIIAVAREHDNLAEAVEIYAGEGMSISATSKRMHLHPNSVSYRLERWSKLSGQDIRSPEGLVASIVARSIARSEVQTKD